MAEPIRALDLLDVLPAGHAAILVRDDAFEPHLHRGELAVIDTADKDRLPGELYALEMDGRPHPVSTLR